MVVSDDPRVAFQDVDYALLVGAAPQAGMERSDLLSANGGIFEPAWEECWHAVLVDGENCIHANRKTLGEVLSRLRSDSELAKRIAAGAARLVATHLSPSGVQDLFEVAWKAQMGLTPNASAKLTT